MDKTDRTEKRIRIVSTGGVKGTRIFDDQGRDISHLISRVEWQHQCGGAPTAVLHFICAEFEGELEAADVTSMADTARRFKILAAPIAAPEQI
jgi:hypothetical protein